jgi:hypothetical protein
MKLIDPLAQSFYVEPDSGIFVTSIDLYFSAKDTTLPVTIQLRPMSQGLPSKEVYPFGEVILEPGQINTSTDASIATKVTFPAPVYLSGQEFHSICVLSNSNNYRVWTSRLGEVDISLSSGEEAREVFVTQSPLSGNLFKAQNGSTWFPSQYEDLKFTLRRAEFANNGNINFYNPELSEGNEEVATLIKDPLITNSRKIRVGLGTTVSGLYDSDLQVGLTISQSTTNATATLVGFAGSATGDLTLTNPGIGYSTISGSAVHNGVTLVSLTGDGESATADITVTNGVAVAATIVNGGSGYVVGDVLTVESLTGSTIGRNMQLTVANTYGNNTLILDRVQGEFSIGAGNTIQYTNLSGVITIATGIAASSISVSSDGLHIKVNHRNHGMCTTHGSVILSDILPDTAPARLTAAYEKSSTIAISIDGTNDFGVFEGVGVGSTNPGYAIIGDEIVSYQNVVNNQLTGITRNIDDTLSYTYAVGTEIRKYELSGVSLRRINKEHALSNVTVSNPLDLDFYHVKLDTSTNGVDRSTGTSFPKLYLNETKSTGGAKVKATQNIIFEIVKPVVQTMTVRGTNINSSIRTVTAHTVAGGETPYLDQGFESISLKKSNYLTSPRMIASKVNETNDLSSLPGNKSFTMNMNLSTSDSRVSPVIDLDRVSVILTSNRINNPISNYATDQRTSTLAEDPSAFVYATKPIALEVPANAIKVLFSAYINQSSDVRVFYAIQEEPSDEPVYYPFPGHANVDSEGVVDISNSDGSSDVNVPKTDTVGFTQEELIYRDYEFTIDELPSFRYFSIKVVGSSTNQVYPPRLRDLRIIALA